MSICFTSGNLVSISTGGLVWGYLTTALAGARFYGDTHNHVYLLEPFREFCVQRHIEFRSGTIFLYSCHCFQKGTRKTAHVYVCQTYICTQVNSCEPDDEGVGENPLFSFQRNWADRGA